MSALNPNATSYVPISKREVPVASNFFELSLGTSTKMAADKHSSTGSPSNAVAQKGSTMNKTIAWNCPSSNAVSGCNKDTKMKGKKEENTNSQMMKDLFFDEEMDLAYLHNLFPDVSEVFIAEVFFVHGGDVESSIDMLYELESVPAGGFADVPESSKAGKPLGSNLPAAGSSSSGLRKPAP